MRRKDTGSTYGMALYVCSLSLWESSNLERPAGVFRGILGDDAGAGSRAGSPLSITMNASANRSPTYLRMNQAGPDQEYAEAIM